MDGRVVAMLGRTRAALLGIGAVVAALVSVALVLDAAYPPALERYTERSSAVVGIDGHILRGFTTPNGVWRFAADPGEVDPAYLKMLTVYEDKRFFSHPGVDPLAIVRAALQWLSAGRPVSGASTLTMQVVRLLEPRSRTLAGKAIETVRALQLEWHFSKQEILAIYLTIAPFGGNLEGIKAATRFYLGKEPRRLTPGEAALLVVLPQSPEKFRPDRYPASARAARDKVLARMEGMGYLSVDAVRVAREELVPQLRKPAPMLAPHLARALDHAAPQTDVHRTFVDANLQKSVEDLASRFAGRLEKGANVAVLVVENETRKVRGYVGSAEFLDNSRHGQVDMVRAVRSPGSTLKPFIYAAAIDAFAVHPETLIADKPMRFGDYAPVNFDLKFRGDITIREALQLSLNVPAVAVLDRLGAARFARQLEKTGAHLRFDPRVKAPALPIALGGVGLTMWDLVGVFVGLANGGNFAPLRRSEIDAAQPGTHVFSPLASWYVAEILRGAAGPRGRVAARHAATQRRIALKTGTTYGFRDAWAIGFDAGHTVGVWVGRPDGGFGTNRTGRLEAAPLLYDVFDLLPLAGAGADIKPPAGAIVARNADLPAPMQKFNTGNRLTVALVEENSEFAVSFPPDGSTVELGADKGGSVSLRLRAQGGRKPLRWLVDGRPIASKPFKRTAFWSGNNQGRVRITAIDRDGRVASSGVWITVAH